ncbi:MAG: hypothetical protein ACRD3D_13980 [Terriglobia bacterium]
MRTTVDVQDPFYRQLKARAATEGRSVKELILHSVRLEMRGTRAKGRGRINLPILPSKKPGTLRLDNASIYKIFPFP